MGFFIATAYWQLSSDSSAVQNKVGLLFFMMLSSFMNASSLLPTFLQDRPLATRERRAQLYGAVAHMFGTLLTIFPLEIINQLTFATYIYWATGLDSDVPRFLYFLLIYVR
jgi:ABC-type multidrug transport system permease subunit